MDEGRSEKSRALGIEENASAEDRVRALEDLYRRLETELEEAPDQADPPRH